MTATTDHTRPASRTSGAANKRKQRARAEGRIASREEAAAAAMRAERLALGNARAAEPAGARKAYAERFRARLLEEADRLDDLDPYVFGLAHSRAAVALAERTGLHPLDAGGVRLQVQAEERSRLGLDRPGAPSVTPDGDLVESVPATGEERDGEGLRVPGRGRARADRVRRGGSRR